MRRERRMRRRRGRKFGAVGCEGKKEDKRLACGQMQAHERVMLSYTFYTETGSWIQNTPLLGPP